GRKGRSRNSAGKVGSLPPSRHVRSARRADVRPMPAFMPEAQKAVDYSFGVLESRTAQTLLSPTAPVRGFNTRRSVAVNEQEERRMANAAEFLARWKARYIDAEGRILEELDTTIAE